MVVFWTAALFVGCVVVALVLYRRGGPDGGPAPYRTTQEVDRARLDRKQERDHSFEKAEKKFQDEQAKRRARGER